MKEFLKYFFPTVLLFMSIGFVAGWTERGKSAALGLYAASDVVSLNDKYFISVDCGTNYTFRFSVDSGAGSFDRDKTPSDTVVHYQKTSLEKPSENHMKIVASLGTMLGGGFAEHSRRKLSELIAESKKKPKFWTWKNLKNNVYSVLGMITGYAIGNSFSRYYDVGCESDIALEILDDKETWNRFKMLRLLATAAELQNIKNANVSVAGGYNDPFKRDPIKLCNTTLSANLSELEDSLEQSDPTLNSYHYANLDNFNKRYLSAAPSEVYRELSRLSVVYVAEKTSTLKNKEIFEKKYRSIAKKIGYSEEKWQELCRQLEELTAS